MGAHWNLIAVTSITVTMDKSDYDKISEPKRVFPEKYTTDYTENSREIWIQNSSYIGDRKKNSITHTLSDENLCSIKEFLFDTYSYLGASSVPHADELPAFVERNFSTLKLPKRIPKDEDKIDSLLNELKGNFYLTYESIPNMVVYSGWPKDLKDESRTYSIEGYVFLTSPMKMGEYPEGEVEYEIAKRELISRLSSKYTIAKYILNLGY